MLSHNALNDRHMSCVIEILCEMKSFCLFDFLDYGNGVCLISRNPRDGARGAPVEGRLGIGVLMDRHTPLPFSSQPKAKFVYGLSGGSSPIKGGC